MCGSMCCNERLAGRQRGLTLVELIVFIVIVGVALAGILTVFNQTTRGSADPLVRKQALAVAESLLEEISALPYACPAGATCVPVTLANRTQTHATADYHGFSMAGIRTIDNTAIAALAGYTATVEVVPETLNGRAGHRIAVTVTGGAESVRLEGWRGQY